MVKTTIIITITVTVTDSEHILLPVGQALFQALN